MIKAVPGKPVIPLVRLDGATATDLDRICELQIKLDRALEERTWQVSLLKALIFVAIALFLGIYLGRTS